MRIAVDITHPCDINFFRAPIRRWLRDGHSLQLVYLDRGIVPTLVRHEYPDLAAQSVGRHASGKWGLYLQTGALRELQLFRALAGRSIDVVVGFPGFQGALVARLLGIKSLGAYDDPEHRPNMLLARAFCHRLVVPEYLGLTGGNLVPCRALKEWSYLAPAHFSADPGALAPYGLKPRGYWVLREVEPRSLNYEEQRLPGGETSMVEAAYNAGLCEDRVLLSLEDKRRKSLFPRWTILEEPVEDLYSLMHYSRGVCSNGDSMAREAAQLGVPSFYLGDRAMKANSALYSMQLMRQISTEPRALLEALRALPPLTESSQRAVRERLDATWEDPTDVLTRVLGELYPGEP